MGFLELALIGVGLSMDAFAVSICKGLSMRKVDKKYMLVLAAFFGGFQALMPTASASILVATANRKNSFRSIRTLSSGQTSSFSPFSLITSKIIFPPIKVSKINAIQWSIAVM